MNIHVKNSKPNGIETFLALDLYNKFSNNTFNQVIYFMGYTENIQGCTLFLKYLQEETNMDVMITERELLSLYMICFFHNDVLSTNKNETESLLYEKCKELITIIEEYTQNLNTYNESKKTKKTLRKPTLEIKTYVKKLNTCSILFNVWKSKDLESQKDIYLSMYVDYSEEIDTFIQKAKDIHKLDYYKKYIQTLMDMKQKIKNCLVQLIGEKECEDLLQDKTNPIGIFNTDSKHVITQYVHEAYWNIFKNNVEGDTIQNKDIINDLAVTIKTYMKHMYEHNTEKLNSIYSQIDFIVNAIYQNCTIKENLIDLLYILYNELIFFSPTNKILTKVEEKLENLEDKDIDVVIYLFKIVMNEYDKNIIQ